MITINEVLLASQLAHDAAFQEMRDLLNSEDDMWVNKDNEDEELQYTDEIQEVYSRWYDYFYAQIMTCVDEPLKLKINTRVLDEEGLMYQVLYHDNKIVHLLCKTGDQIKVKMTDFIEHFKLLDHGDNRM